MAAAISTTLRDEISELDLDQMTPIQALNKLAELQSLLAASVDASASAPTTFNIAGRSKPKAAAPKPKPKAAKAKPKRKSKAKASKSKSSSSSKAKAKRPRRPSALDRLATDTVAGTKTTGLSERKRTRRAPVRAELGVDSKTYNARRTGTSTYVM
mgnify:CR=1 FL=1